MWKALHGAIPIGYNLEKRGIINDTTCPNCGQQETLDHIFLNCNYAKGVWRLMPITKDLSLSPQQQFEQLVHTAKHVTDSPVYPRQGSHPKLSSHWLVGHYGKQETKSCLRTEPSHPQETATKVISDVREWQAAQLPIARGTVPQPEPACDSAPITIHTDAAWNVLGWVLFNHTDSTTLQGNSTEYFVRSTMVAEALAIRTALTIALDKNWTHIHLKLDDQDLIQAITGRKMLKEAFGIIHDIIVLANCFTSISFSYVSRSCNVSADSLAKGAPWAPTQACSCFFNLMKSVDQKKRWITRNWVFFSRWKIWLCLLTKEYC